MYKRQIYQIAEWNRIEKIDSVARIESNRIETFFRPNWNALMYSGSKKQKCRVLLNMYLASPAATVVCMFCRCFYVFTISVRPITSASIDICRPRPSCRSTGQTDGRTPYRLHRRNSAGTVGRMTRISRYAPNNGNFVGR